MSRRIERLAPTIREAVQQVITRGLSDPRIRGMITVTKVTISDDLREATIAVSVYPPEHAELTVHGLVAASRHIRRQAGELVSLAKMPTLRIKLDQTLSKQAAVFEALAKARAETKASPEPQAGAEEDAANAGSDPGSTAPPRDDREDEAR